MGNNSAVDRNQTVLEVKDLKKHFKSGTGKNKLIVPAVDGVSLNVYKREVFGLVGESGCGKTTTGRTIIKLYNATEGFVKLNGDLVSIGYKGILNQIKEVKLQAKKELLAIDKHADAVHKIEEQLESDIIDADYNLKKQLNASDARIKELHQPVDDYRNSLYKVKNDHELAVAKVVHQYNLSATKIKNSTQNSVKAEYKRELEGYKLGLKRKTEGLKESAALHKEVIAQRIKELKEEYAGIFADLEKEYAFLIAEAEQNIVPKAEAKIKLRKLTEDKNWKVSALAREYRKERSEIKKPDMGEIKKAVQREKNKKKRIMSQYKREISDLRKNAKDEIAKVPSNEELGVDKINLAEQKRKILAKQKTEVKKLKDEISYAKQVNKSKEALLNSRKMQMIFQDPISSLNPRLTVEEIVGEGLIIRGGYSKAEIKEKVGETLELVGLQREYAARYPHEFSGGQRQRIGVARALIMSPDFIIADEPISALDVSIRAQVINLLRELKEKLGLTIMFIAHDLSVVRFFCDRIAVMYYGKIVEMADSEELFANPMHPYTISLLSSVPQPDPDYEKNRTKISYNPSEQHDYRHDKPKLREIVPGHTIYANDKEFKQIKEKYFENNERNGEAL